MNSEQVGEPKLFCVSCRKKRKIQVQLNSYQLNPSLGIYMCTTNECLYPLSTKNLHKFVYKISSNGEFLNCDPSEVPSLKDLFALLSANANISANDSQPEKEKNSSSPCDIPQIAGELVHEEQEKGEQKEDSELTNSHSKTIELIPKKKTCDDSVSYGAKFGTSSKVNVFPIWENKDAMCWLDSTLCLLVHSKNLKAYFKSETFEECQLKDISIAYDEAVSILNSEKKSTRAMKLAEPFANLEKVRERAFNFLQPFQRCEKGQEDSPVFAIMVLLKQNKCLHRLFLLHFSLELRCNSCGYMKVSQNRKTLVTIPSVLQEFSENQLVYLRPCFQCQKPDQKITQKFLKLPPLLLMHFVEGLPHSNISLYDRVFSLQGYCVRGFVQYREPERHFITWVRDDTGDQWMCCDDLNPPVQRFKAKLPDIAASEIHIVMWEKKQTIGEDNFHLHYSDDDNCNDSLSSIESASPPLIILDDSDCEIEASKSQKSCGPQKVLAERTVSTPTEKQHEEIIKENGLSYPLRNKDSSPPYKSTSNISKELNHAGVRSVTSDCRQVACRDLVAHSSSDGSERENFTEEQEAHIQNKSSVPQKDIIYGNFIPPKKSCNADYVCDTKGHSESGLVPGDVHNQNITEASESFLTMATKCQSVQFSPDSIKQDKDINSANSTVIPKNENRLVNTELERDIDSVVNDDIFQKNKENTLNLEECGSPLHEKSRKSPAVSQQNTSAQNPSGAISPIVKQEAVINQENVDHIYSKTLCKSIRECYVVVSRSEVEVFTKKKLVEQNTVHSTRPSLRKEKCAQMITEHVDVSSTTSVKYKGQGKKRKGTSVLKQCSLDAGLQDMGNTGEDVKSQAIPGSGFIFSCSVASESAPPGEKFPKKQTTELQKCSVESSVPGQISEYSSNHLVPDTGSTVFSKKLPVKREQQNLNKTSQKISIGEQQNIVQKNNADCDGNNILSTRSLNVKQLVKENERLCEIVQKEIKNENAGSSFDDLDAKNNAPSKMSLTSDPVTFSKNQSLSTQALSCPSSPSVHSVSVVNLDTSSKIVNTCGSLCFKLEDKNSSCAELARSTNSSTVATSEVLKGDVSTAVEFKGSEVNTSLCDKGCTCDLCSVVQFLQNHDDGKPKPQDVSHDAEVLNDVSVDFGSSRLSVSVVEQAEHDQNSTVIMQNKSLVSPKRAYGTKSYTKDNSLPEKRKNIAVHSKVTSRKCATSRQNQSTVGRKEICKNTTNKSETSQEHKSCVDDLHDKDLNVSQTFEGNDGDVTVRKFETFATTTLPQVQHSCENTELGHSEQINIVSPIRTGKNVVETGSASVDTLHLPESSVQENLNQPVAMTSLPEEVCESVEKQVAVEQLNKRVTYLHFGRQRKLCIVNAENDSGGVVVQHEKSDHPINSPISKRGKTQQSDEEGADISPPVSNTSLRKLQCRRVCNKLSPIEHGFTFLGDGSVDDSTVLKQKVERKFEPDSVRFVEIPVDSQSSDIESTEDGRKYGEMPQAVTVQLSSLFAQKKTATMSGTKKESSERNVIKYRGITAVFEPFVDDDVESTGILTKEHFSFNGMPNSRSSPDGVNNNEVPSCAPRSSKKTRQQKGASCSFVKESKKIRKKKTSLQVLDSEKTSPQRSHKQNIELESKDLSCCIDVLMHSGTSMEIITRKDMNYLTAAKKGISEHNAMYKCLKNQNDVQASQDELIPTSSVENQAITTDMTSETGEKARSSACQIQDHCDAPSGILPQKKGRKNPKVVRFSIEPNDNTAKQGRKKITSLSEKEASGLQGTVCEKIGGVNTVSQEASTRKRNSVDTSANSRKKIRSKTSVSSVQNVELATSEEQDDKDDKPKAQQGNLSQEAKPSTSYMPQVNRFIYFPKDLTLNDNFSVSVPRPQVTKVTCTPKGS